MSDLYADLGVEPTATPEEINAAFRQRAKSAHPDAGGDTDAFARLQRAVAVLRDPDKRARYDATGTVDDTPASEQGEAIEVLINAFMQVLQGTQDLRYDDLVGQTDTVLRGFLDNLKGQRADALRRQKQLGDALARLGHAGDKPDVIRTALEANAASVVGALAELERREAVVNAARAMAEGYSWQVDERPAPAAPQWVFVGAQGLNPNSFAQQGWSPT